MERWKKIGLFTYEISSLGRVRNSKGKVIKQWLIGNSGYLSVFLRVDKKQTTFSVHRLVALMFVDNPHGKHQVNHKDGDKLNNAYKNLEWATRSENMQHMYDTGLKTYKPLHYKGKFGSDHNRSKSVRCSNGKVYGSMSEAERDLGFGGGTISRSIVEGRSLRCGLHFEIGS